MQNLPRIFINEKLEVGKQIPLSVDQAHYLTRVMRTDKCLVFNDGVEFSASVKKDKLEIVEITSHKDPGNKIVFCFAPIKQSRMEEMLNATTQMGVAVLQPVITERTTEHFPKWGRIKKIIIEASEQSGRNSIPKLEQPIKFSELDKKDLVFADERFAHDKTKQNNCTLNFANCTLLVGPEGGFSENEFSELDAAGAIGISLGKTILRAETAAVAALSKII